MGYMRHLSVPTDRAQDIIEIIRGYDWQSSEYRIHQIEQDKIVIPLSAEVPDTLPENIIGDIVFIDPIPNPQNHGSWKEIFEKEIGHEMVSKLDDRLSRGHEIIGDIMIQPAHRFDDGRPDYVDVLVRAKMKTHPRIRLTLFDYGVKGKFRVRDLEVAAVRLDGIVQGDELQEIPAELLSSETTIKESGLHIHLDPREVYYSGKLENERLETTRKLLDFRDEINRPLAICDLYCGVGPNLVHLFPHHGLTGPILANDLNPACIPYLFRNLPPLKSLSFLEINGILQVTEDIQIANMDALELASDRNQHGRWDVLFVNLPHDSLEHLPHLIPLLRKDTPSIIRGWSILPTSELSTLSDRLFSILRNRSSHSDISFKVRKQYGATKSMVGFWIRIRPE